MKKSYVLTTLEGWRQDLWDAGWRVRLLKLDEAGLKFLLWESA
jgi:hypothetical protein